MQLHDDIITQLQDIDWTQRKSLLQGFGFCLQMQLHQAAYNPHTQTATTQQQHNMLQINFIYRR